MQAWQGGWGSAGGCRRGLCRPGTTSRGAERQCLVRAERGDGRSVPEDTAHLYLDMRMTTVARRIRRQLEDSMPSVNLAELKQAVQIALRERLTT